MSFRTTNLFAFDPCKECEGATALINEFGMVKPCGTCNLNPKAFQNKYGVDNADAPIFFIDNMDDKGIIAAVDQKKDYVLLPDGTAIEHKEDFII